MATLSLFPLSLSLRLKQLTVTAHHSSSQTHLSSSISSPQISPRNTHKLTKLCNNKKTQVLFGGNLPNEPTTPDESMFKGEDGVIEDMDGYLNYLSLEYDSVWDTKPSWCQPWTIVISGVAVVACSWLILHSVIVTSVVLFLICTWWYIFLYSYPKAYSDMIAERRKKVTDGVEDTYGLRRSNDIN